VLENHKALAGISEDALAKYVKLVRLGQPVEHVKAKMKADGFDPDALAV
jgi:hypothetical protein